MSAYNQYLNSFGICKCKNPNVTDYLNFEFQDEYSGRYYMDRVPYCSDCMGVV